MKPSLRWPLLAAVALLAACSHPVRIAPPPLTLYSDPSLKIDKAVGYHMTDAQRALQTTTRGGGGDKISYFPYRDLEGGLYQTLASVFSSVYVVPDANAQGFIADKHLTFVFVPELTTDSSSTNVMLWNPTNFTVRLHVTANDAAGKPVWSRDLVGQARTAAGGSLTETPAAQKAAADVFAQLQKALLDEPLFRNPPAPAD